MDQDRSGAAASNVIARDFVIHCHGLLQTFPQTRYIDPGIKPFNSCAHSDAPLSPTLHDISIIKSLKRSSYLRLP